MLSLGNTGIETSRSDVLAYLHDPRGETSSPGYHAHPRWEIVRQWHAVRNDLHNEMKLEPRKGRESEHAGSRPTNLGLPPFSALELWDTYLTEQVPRRAFLLFLRACDEKETVAADAAAAVPGLGHLSNLHNNSRPMWASSTSYCKLPFFRLHTFHFWKGGLVTLNPGRRRAGRLGGGRSPRLLRM